MVAKPILEKIAAQLSDMEAKVLPLPIPVAAMMTSEYLARELPRHPELIEWADVIIAPGFTKGDLEEVAKRVGKPVYKGCLYAYDIPIMIEYLKKGGKLSPINPLDGLLTEEKRKREESILAELKSQAENSSFEIGGEPISHKYPLIIGEVFVNGEADFDVIASKARRLVSHGADILVIGSSRLPFDTVVEYSRKIKQLVKKPVGVDYLRFEAFSSLSDGEVDMLLSLPAGSIPRFDSKEEFRKTAVVIIPDPLAATVEEKISSLRTGLKYAFHKGFGKVVLDPVLNPPQQGLIESLYAFKTARKEFQNHPILMGVSNFTELIDADSIGVNATLASIGVEAGVDLFLVTEESDKTVFSIKEFRRALDMALLAREMEKPPKDFSVNLLVCKSKKRRRLKPQELTNPVKASHPYPLKADPSGYFKIYVDHDQEAIIVEHYKHGSNKPDITIVGTEPSTIFSEILERRLASSPEHFYYLGKELWKAKTALKLGKDYIQDEELF